MIDGNLQNFEINGNKSERNSVDSFIDSNHSMIIFDYTWRKNDQISTKNWVSK